MKNNTPQVKKKEIKLTPLQEILGDIAWEVACLMESNCGNSGKNFIDFINQKILKLK